VGKIFDPLGKGGGDVGGGKGTEEGRRALFTVPGCDLWAFPEKKPDHGKSGPGGLSGVLCV